jgi:hypothetical protein
MAECEGGAASATRGRGGRLVPIRVRREQSVPELEPEPEPESESELIEMTHAPLTPLDAAQGLLVGLAAGDRNRGPIQMCLALAESIGRTGSYDPASVLQSYREWWSEGEGEDAWDTGPTTAAVLLETTSGCTVDIAEQAAMDLDKKLGGLTAGANAAHRVLALALARGCLRSGTELADAARQESRLTHWSTISQHTCAVLCHIARGVLEGRSLEACMAEALAMEASLAPDEPTVCQPLRELLGGETTQSDLRNDGFCPHVRPAQSAFLSLTSPQGET